MSDSTPNPPPEGFQPPPPPGETPPTGSGPGMPPPPGQPYPDQPGYGPGYGPGGPAPTGGVGQPAGLGSRFLARLIDGIVVAVVNGILTAILVVGIMGGSAGYGLRPGNNYAASAVSSILTAVLYLGYFTLMESRSGQTLGKMILKLQTQGPDGAIPSTEQALKRNAWSGLAILGVVPFLGFVASLLELAAVIAIAVTISGSPTKQGWHDNFAGGTRVIKIG
jgi:uncharacterized RDD family membrane protein YckC